MDRTIHLLDRRLEVTSHDELGDQFARMWTDDMRTEELTVLLVPDDLHEAVSITHRPSTTTRTPWERAALDIVPCLLRLRLSHPDRRSEERRVGKDAGARRSQCPHQQDGRRVTNSTCESTH